MQDQVDFAPGPLLAWGVANSRLFKPTRRSDPIGGRSSNSCSGPDPTSLPVRSQSANGSRKLQSTGQRPIIRGAQAA